MDRLDKVRDTPAEALRHAEQIVRRAAAIDTGAIEGLYETDRGFTVTVATEAAMWQAAFEQKGKDARDLIQAQMDAYELAFDVATQREPVTEARIRRLHEELCRTQATYKTLTAVGPQDQALPKGQYKTQPNHVILKSGTVFSYCPVHLTAPEMHRFCEEIRSEEFERAHPAFQAAYAHYAFVLIHPFADGNGRVARLLGSIYYWRALSIPLLILLPHTAEYHDSLSAADQGNRQEFVDFVADRALDAAVLVEQSLATVSTPSADRSIQKLRELTISRAGYSHEELDRAAQRLLKSFEKVLLEQLTGVAVGGAITNVSVHLTGSPIEPPGGYRASVPHSGVAYSANAASPVTAHVDGIVGCEVPKDPTGTEDVRLRWVNRHPSRPARDLLLTSLSRLMPIVAPATDLQIRMAVETLVRETLSLLVDEAQRLQS